MSRRRKNENAPVTIMITRSERELILRYGYPFDDIQRQLGESDEVDLLRVIDVPFYWEHLILNLRMSVKEKSEIQRDKNLWESVEELILKIAEKLGLT